MAQVTIMRTERSWPVIDAVVGAVSDFLFGVVDGFTRDDKRAWRRIWKRIKAMEAGEMLVIDVVQPRSGPFHRRHMKIEQSVFDAQDRFTSFDQFRVWLKVGAGWCDWFAGAKGGVVPIPKSISYAKADQDEFAKYHEAVIDFLRGGHAARFLWRHMDRPDEMMNSILEDFGE